MKKYFVLTFGTVMLAFMGLIYAWSVVAGPLKGELAMTPQQISAVFTCSIAFFALGTLLAGVLARKHKPSFIYILSAVYLALGFFLSSHAVSYICLCMFYGALCGLGIGLIYNITIATVSKWFATSLGLCSGVLLMGYGAGAMVLAPAYVGLCNLLGWRTTFALMACLFAVFALLATVIVTTPHATGTAATTKKREYFEDITSGEVLKRKSFWFAFIFLAFTGASALAIFAQARLFVASVMAETSLPIVVGLLSVSNGLGRIALGTIYDRLKLRRAATIDGVLFILAIFGLLLALRLHCAGLLVASICLTGFAFGGSTPLLPVWAYKMYGPRDYSLNMSFLCTNLIPASVIGPTISGGLFGLVSSLDACLYVLLALVGVAVVLLQFVSYEKNN